MANEKVISTEALINKFRQALADDWGYIWGTAGELWTAVKQKELEKTTDADRANSRKYGAQWIGHKVADCSGLFSWAFKQLGGYMYHGSDTMYRKYCTATGELKSGARTDGQGLKPGTAVFVWKESKKKYTHVGLYVGNGLVIEAAGARQGVISGKVTASKWTHWGELKGVDYSGVQPDPEQPSEPADDKDVVTFLPTLRRGSKGEYVKKLQKSLQKFGYNLGSYGVDGDFGRATEAAVKAFQMDRGLKVDGVCGPATWAALDNPSPEPTPEPVVTLYTVHIPYLTEDRADGLIAQYSGSWKTTE